MKIKAVTAATVLLLLALTGCSGAASASPSAPATPTATAMPAGSITPDVTGGSLDEAAAKLKAAGITFDIYDDTGAAMEFRQGSGLTVYRTMPEKKDPLPTSHMTLYVQDTAAVASARATEEAKETYSPVPERTYTAPEWTPSPTPTPTPKSSITYTVTSDAPIEDVTIDNTIRWHSDGMEQFSQPGPKFTKTYHFDENLYGPDGDMLAVTAQAGDAATTITCTISNGDYVASKKTSTGPYAVVSCNW